MKVLHKPAISVSPEYVTDVHHQNGQVKLKKAFLNRAIDIQKVFPEDYITGHHKKGSCKCNNYVALSISQILRNKVGCAIFYCQAV